MLRALRGLGYFVWRQASAGVAEQGKVHRALCWPCMELALSCKQQREAKTVPCGGLCMTLGPWDRLCQAIMRVNGLVSRR